MYKGSCMHELNMIIIESAYYIVYLHADEYLSVSQNSYDAQLDFENQDGHFSIFLDLQLI